MTNQMQKTRSIDTIRERWFGRHFGERSRTVRSHGGGGGGSSDKENNNLFNCRRCWLRLFHACAFGTASDSLGFRVSQPYPMNRYNLRLGCLRGSRVSNLQLWD